MYTSIKDQLRDELEEIRTAGLYKTERSISSPQSSHITAGQIGGPGADVLNFCANNYLGLADHPEIISAAKAAGVHGVLGGGDDLRVVGQAQVVVGAEVQHVRAGLAELAGRDVVGLRRVDVPFGLEQAGAADLIEFVLQLVLDG